MADFTPGKWEAEFHERNTVRGNDVDHWTVEGEVYAGRFGVVADMLNMHHCIDPDTARANAKLISASPDLFQAAKAALAVLDEQPDSNSAEAARLLKQAIQKATE